MKERKEKIYFYSQEKRAFATVVLVIVIFVIIFLLRSFSNPTDVGALALSYYGLVFLGPVLLFVIIRCINVITKPADEEHD